MNKYQEILDEFSSEAYLSFNQTVPIESWGDKKAAELYLEKYWLSNKEYFKHWKPKKDDIFFNYGNGLPDLTFSENFKVIISTGGCLFQRKDYELLKKCLTKTGDTHFVVIENSFGGKINNPLKFKYPVNITWEELTSGNFISSAIVDNSAKEYFVFGDSINWGKYSANDYFDPIDLIVFKDKYASIFDYYFKNEKINTDKIQNKIYNKFKSIIYNE